MDKLYGVAYVHPVIWENITIGFNMDDQEEMRILRELESLPYHIKISKMSKGYQWEVSIRGKDKETILKELQEIDERLKKTYGQL